MYKGDESDPAMPRDELVSAIHTHISSPANNESIQDSVRKIIAHCIIFILPTIKFFPNGFITIANGEFVKILQTN